jgi:hypothetical protein
VFLDISLRQLHQFPDLDADARQQVRLAPKPSHLQPPLHRGNANSCWPLSPPQIESKSLLLCDSGVGHVVSSQCLLRAILVALLTLLLRDAFGTNGPGAFPAWRP